MCLVNCNQHDLKDDQQAGDDIVQALVVTCILGTSVLFRFEPIIHRRQQ